MTNKKTANDLENKKSRAIRETNKEDFVKVINDVKELLNDDAFVENVCEKTANGLYKMTTTAPNDMTGVKRFESQGLTWFKVPTSDYRLSLTSYISYKLTCETKARSNAIKQLAELSTEELLEILAAKK